MITKVFSSIKEIDKNVWDSIIPPDHIICTYDYNLAMENSGINDCVYRYIMVYDEDKLIAHTTIYSMSFDLDIFDKGFSKKLIQFCRKTIKPDFMRIKVIECGTPTALGNTITMAPGYDKKQILKEITTAMTAYAREKGINILIYRDFYHADLPDSDNLRKLGFKRVRVLPNAEVINHWENFDEYMNDMRSRYRYRLKKFLKSMDKSGITLEVRHTFADLSRELTDLWFQIYNHAKEYKREVLTPAYFENMDRCLGDKSLVLLFKKGEQIIAFDFIIIDDFTLRPLFIGLDYQYNEQDKLYFNILGQSVKMGIDLKKKTIEMGITTIGPKKEMGAEMIPAFGYMKHLKPISNLIVPNLFALFSPPTFRDRKHVFNRRFYERVYSILNLTLAFNNQTIAVTSTDISESGIRVISPVALKRSSKNITLIGFKTEREENSFNLKGKIVWVKKEADHYAIGIWFAKLHPQVKEKLAHIITYQKMQKNNEE